MDARRSVPRTDAVLADPRLQPTLARLDRATVKAAVLAAQEEARSGRLAPEDVVGDAVARLPAAATSLHRVLNATGVVLHTNLGRAALAPEAFEALVAAVGFVDVEFDLASGTRAKRGRGTLAALSTAVPDAGDVHLTNNGAAALLLAVTAVAAGREVVVSRGELVEIGDGFRLPDLLVATSARLREVGTTNRTSLADYEQALGPQTGCVLKVHPSNFQITGFTSSVSTRELAELGAGAGVPVVVDIGSGLLAPEPLLPGEPDAASALQAGASLVTASGDKLLGGPQAGLLLGDAALVERCRRLPLARSMRVDKLTLAAMEATLLARQTPTRAALHADPTVLYERAQRLAAATGGSVLPSAGRVGGGGAPGVELPGWAVAYPEPYAALLRRGDPAVVGRVSEGRCLVDLRCIPADADGALTAAVCVAAASAGSASGG